MGAGVGEAEVEAVVVEERVGVEVGAVGVEVVVLKALPS